MQSSLIGKIEKAKRYAQETDRVTFKEFTTTFRGENSEYETSYHDGSWHCTCSFFASWGLCVHTMAVERMISPMLPPEARDSQYDISGISADI